MRFAGRRYRHGLWGERWRAELQQRWRYGLGVAVVIVLLPLVAGYPDRHTQFGHLRGEASVAIVSTVVFASLLLFLASAINRETRAAWFGLAGLVLICTHPILDASFDTYPLGTTLTRTTAAAAVIIARCLTLDRLGRFGQAVRNLGAVLAVVAVAFGAVSLFVDVPLLDASLAYSLAVAAVAVGGIDFVIGQRETNGGVASLSMTMLSFGFGGLLLLASGGRELTANAAAITTLTALFAVAVSTWAIFEALARREAMQEAIELSEALALSRLGTQTDRLAQVVHDQAGALLAIEAAAQRLRDHPSDDLAAAVAAEAGRLQRSLALEAEASQTFELNAALHPMVACMRSLGVEVKLADSDISVWAPLDEVVEIVRALVDNCRAHGTAPVEIEVHQVGDEAVVVVSDQGPGVPVALQESIFERGVTTHPRSHSGLGLYSARRSVLELGGGLRVAPNRPSAFEVRLPTRAPRDSPLASPAVAETDPTDESIDWVESV
jgi:signal transduction histidine kinase